MARHKLNPGDRIQLKVRMLCGYKGCGTVIETHDFDDGEDYTLFFKTDRDKSAFPPSLALRSEVKLLK